MTKELEPAALIAYNREDKLVAFSTDNGGCWHFKKGVENQVVDREEPLDRRSDWVEHVRDLLDELSRDSDGHGPTAADAAGRNFDRGWDAALELVRQELPEKDGKTVEGRPNTVDAAGGWSDLSDEEVEEMKQEVRDGRTSERLSESESELVESAKESESIPHEEAKEKLGLDGRSPEDSAWGAIVKNRLEDSEGEQ